MGFFFPETVCAMKLMRVCTVLAGLLFVNRWKVMGEKEQH